MWAKFACTASDGNNGGVIMKMYEDVSQAIGNTPMVNLSRITKVFGVEGNIFAKLEYLNPGFSKKDRVALQMIVEAEEAGLLTPGQGDIVWICH